jgi:microcystin-dependent protein
MARILANISNTEAPSSDYPKGRILDRNLNTNPVVLGTPIKETVYGDIIQVFLKCLEVSGIIENDLPDNETNGYQLLEALRYELLPKRCPIPWYPFASDDPIPTGWLLCDGNNGTPDLRNRFIMGATDEFNVGTLGGANTVTLNEDQIPAHKHLLVSSFSYPQEQLFPTNQISKSLNESSIDNYFITGTQEPADIGLSSQTGGGKAHENRPAYCTCYFIIKL